MLYRVQRKMWDYFWELKNVPLQCVCVCVYATCPWLSRTPPPPPPDYDLPSKQAPVSLIPSHPSDSLPSQP